MSFFSDAELFDLGFASLGENVKISRKASIYGAGQISIGNNVRVDDFCILSAGVWRYFDRFIYPYCGLFIINWKRAH